MTYAFFRQEGFSLNEETWVRDIKKKRELYGISQQKLALAAGITRPYLSDIETGKAHPSEALQETITEALERFNPDAPLEMLFDYVRIRFPTTDVKHIVEDVLRLKLPYFIHEDYGFYSYTEHYYLGDIFVLVSPELEKGVLLELKGRGCRQFESYLLAQERSWYEFFMDVLMEDGVMKRLDLAINDKTGILNIPHLTEKCRNEECISVFRSFKSYRSGELVRREEKECMGNTLYIGSLQSEVYFCIYEKDYEQYKKHDIPIAYAEVKNRFEIRLKNERAFYAIRDLLEHDNPERTAFQIINRHVRFVDRDNAKPRSDWRINEEWAWFIGEHRGSLKLTTKPEPYSFERTLHWLSHQVAPTLKLALHLDKMNHTQIVHDMDGFETMKEIRKESSLPILMFTSKNDNASKVCGLRAGADDYLTKPFDMDELIARIISLIRRYTRFNQSDGMTQKLEFDGLHIDIENRSITTENGTFELPPKEFDLLLYCAKHQGKILTKSLWRMNAKTISKRCPDSVNGKPCSVIWTITPSICFLPKTPIHPTSILLKWMDLLSALKTAC